MEITSLQDKFSQQLLVFLDSLAEVINRRLHQLFNENEERTEVEAPSPPPLNGEDHPIARFVHQYHLRTEEYYLLLIALAPHIQSDFFDQIIRKKIPEAGDFPQIGGVRGKQFRGFLPTGETALFILAGLDLSKRFDIQELFSPDHFFSKKRILWLEDPPLGEPRMSGKIILSQEYEDWFTLGKLTRPAFSLTFPAQLLETQMEWEDLVLNDQTVLQIRELEMWINHGDTLLKEWGMSKRLKPGYRALFHGPPGTGKTLTATLLGKYTGKDVYRIDLSMVVSKYIGETEKNLSNLFAKAENKDWILFFDEADALFGKRTNVKDAHDRYANQEVSYLLQRVESYNGLVILASNFKSNIDDAFMRRFQSIVYFPMPKPSERLRIWQQSFPGKVTLTPDVDLQAIARKYELSGAGIINAVQFCCLEALGRGDHSIDSEDIARGIKKEYLKEGRIVH